MAADSGKSYLVECFWPGIDQEQLATATRRVEKNAIAMRDAGADVRFLGSLLMPADEVVFCLLRGSEADVRTACAGAGIPVERVIESLWIDGEKAFRTRPAE
jgi:hypothetical protein